MKKLIGLSWVSRQLVKEMIQKAELAFPDETGGVLIGYWSKPYIEVVITHVVGPGPLAIHTKRSFIPDADYQEAEIARIYKASNRICTYLGDWHTHPGGTARLSFTDHKTLQQIARYSPARAPFPLMAILAGDVVWDLKLWRFSPIKIRGFILKASAKMLRMNMYN